MQFALVPISHARAVPVLAAILGLAFSAMDKGVIGSRAEGGGLSVPLGVANGTTNHAIPEVPSGVRMPGLVGGVNAPVFRIEWSHAAPAGRGAKVDQLGWELEGALLNFCEAGFADVLKFHPQDSLGELVGGVLVQDRVGLDAREVLEDSHLLEASGVGLSRFEKGAVNIIHAVPTHKRNDAPESADGAPQGVDGGGAFCEGFVDNVGADKVALEFIQGEHFEPGDAWDVSWLSLPPEVGEEVAHLINGGAWCAIGCGTHWYGSDPDAPTVFLPSVSEFARDANLRN